MCEPVTLAAGAAVLGAVGTGISAIGQLQAGEANAKQAESNSLLAEKAAQDALDRGDWQVQRLRLQTHYLLGQQRALYGAGNVDLNSKSVQDVRQGSQKLALEDENTIISNAAREAWGLRTQGSQYQAQADQDRSAAGWNAAGTLLTGAASLGGSLGGLFGGGGKQPRIRR